MLRNQKSANSSLSDYKIIKIKMNLKNKELTIACNKEIECDALDCTIIDEYYRLKS